MANLQRIEEAAKRRTERKATGVRLETQQRISKGAERLAERKDDINVTPQQQGIGFSNEQKAHTEVERQRRIRANVETDRPATEGAKKFGGRPDTPAQVQPTQDQSSKKYGETDPALVDAFKSISEKEANKREDLDAKEADLKKYSEDIKKGLESQQQQTRELRETFDQFKSFQDQWAKDSASNAQLYQQDFQGYMNKLKDSVTTELAKQGMEIDESDPSFQEAVAALNAQGKEDGIIPQEQDYAKEYMRLAEGFSKKKEGEEFFQAVPKADLDAQLEADRLSAIQLQLDKEKSFGAVRQVDGSIKVPIGEGDITIGADGKIDYDSLDPNLATLSAIELAQYVNKKYIDDADGAAKEELDRRNKRALEERRYNEAKLNNEYSAVTNWTTKQRELSNDRSELDRQYLEMQEARTVSEMKDSQEKAMAYHTARLAAMGATDSINGLMAIKGLEVDFSDSIARTRENYDYKMADMMAKQNELDFAFVQSIEQIELDKANGMLDIENDYLGKKEDIRQSQYQTDKEKRDKLFELDMGVLKTVQAKEQAAQQAKADILKERKDFAQDLIKQQLKDSPYEYTVNPNTGDFEYLTDSEGNMIPTFDSQYKQMQMVGLQSSADKRMSEQTGFVYMDGVPIEIDGELVPNTKQREFTIEQKYNQDKLDLDKQYKLGMLSATQYRDRTSRIDKSYELIQDEFGEYVEIPRAGFLGTDGKGADVATFMQDTITQSRNNPNYKSGQCGFFGNNIAERRGLGRPFEDDLTSKMRPIPGMEFISPEEFSQSPGEGFAIYDLDGSHPDDQTGHVSFVQLDDSGNPYYSDSNRNNKEKFNQRYAEGIEQKIIGYHVFPQNRGIKTGVKGKKKAADDNFQTEFSFNDYLESDDKRLWRKENIPQAKRQGFKEAFKEWEEQKTLTEKSIRDLSPGAFAGTDYLEGDTGTDTGGETLEDLLKN